MSLTARPFFVGNSKTYDPLAVIPSPEAVRERLRETLTLAERLRILLELADRLRLPLVTADDLNNPQPKGVARAG